MVWGFFNRNENQNNKCALFQIKTSNYCILCEGWIISEHLGSGEHHTHQFGQVLGFIFLTEHVITCEQLDNASVMLCYRYHLCSFVW